MDSLLQRNCQRPPITDTNRSRADAFRIGRRQAPSLPAFLVSIPNNAACVADLRHHRHPAGLVAVEYPAARAHCRSTGRETMILRNKGARLLLLVYRTAVFLLFVRARSLPSSSALVRAGIAGIPRGCAFHRRARPIR